MKVLVIKNLSDIDIICEDGSYAFSWTGDGFRKVQCFRNRMTEKLESLDEFVGGESNVIDMDYDTIIQYVIQQALNWLVPGENNIEAIIVELKDQKLEDLINEFLKFK
jgi:hypothetical protein